VTMKDITYDVRVYKTEVYKGKKVNSYYVRWKVGGEVHRRSFRNAAQADTYRGELQSAARKGEAFARATGEPVSWQRTENVNISWYDFACQYVDMKWKPAAAKYRQDIARALVAATPPLIEGDQPTRRYSDLELRTAMHRWGFNTKLRDSAPRSAAEILRWLSANTLPLTALAEPALARAVLDAATSKLDGKRAASETARKHRMLLSNAMDYAVELRYLQQNPIKQIKWKAPVTTAEVDRRCVVNHSQARALLAEVGKQEPSGPRLVAFFASMYYCALRPEEAVNLREHNIELPSSDDTDAWGALHLTKASPFAGAAWTDDGGSHEERELKHRAEGHTRPVPIPPPMVRIFRQHLHDFPPARGGRVFYGVRRDNELPSVTYRRAWRNARLAALTPQEAASPLAHRPYDLRHACVSTWLNAGVAAPQVAEWAGHGVDVLLRIYAKCIVGQDEAAKRRISEALA